MSCYDEPYRLDDYTRDTSSVINAVRRLLWAYRRPEPLQPHLDALRAALDRWDTFNRCYCGTEYSAGQEPCNNYCTGIMQRIDAPRR